MRWLNLVQNIFLEKKSVLKLFQEFSPPPQTCKLLQGLIYCTVESFAGIRVFQREPKPKIELWYRLVFANSLHCLSKYPVVLSQSCVSSEALVVTGTENLHFEQNTSLHPGDSAPFLTVEESNQVLTQGSWAGMNVRGKGRGETACG